jgi:nucleoside-diphosphate-sugar epimerase
MTVFDVNLSAPEVAGAAVAALVLLAALMRWLRRPLAPAPQLDWEQVARSVEHKDKLFRSLLGPATGRRYLVVGAGSIGSAIVDSLLLRGEGHVAVLDVSIPPRYAALRSNVACFQGDVTNAADVERTLASVRPNVVFYTAALIRYWERLSYQRAPSWRVNVDGLQTCLHAARAMGVADFIYTSTGNVVMRAGVNVRGAGDADFISADGQYLRNEDAPVNHYAATKAVAEKLVLAGNVPRVGGFHTVALRPTAGVFGPRDPFICRDIYVKRAAPTLQLRRQQDLTFVDNVALAHVLAEAALRRDPLAVGGHAYFIGGDEPLTGLHFNQYWTQLRPTAIQVLYLHELWPLACAIEAWQWLTRGGAAAWLGQLATVTPATLHVQAIDFYFSSQRAKEQLGYTPVYTVPEAILKTVRALDIEAKAHAKSAGVAGPWAGAGAGTTEPDAAPPVSQRQQAGHALPSSPRSGATPASHPRSISRGRAQKQQANEPAMGSHSQARTLYAARAESRRRSLSRAQRR